MPASGGALLGQMCGHPLERQLASRPKCSFALDGVLAFDTSQRHTGRQSGDRLTSTERLLRPDRPAVNDRRSSHVESAATPRVPAFA